MSNKKKNHVEEYFVLKKKVMGRITGFFVLIIMVVQPLIVTDFYFNILQTKYYCYWISMVSMFFLLLCASGYFMYIDKRDFGFENTKAYFRDLFSKNWRQHFSVPDLAIIVFWLCAVVSTIGSEFFYESFWGNEGRYSGLFLLTVFFASYFCITRFWHMKKWYIDTFLFAGFLVCLFGITDYFCLNILHFKDHLAPQSYAIFTSTIGNINTYTSYVALVLGVSATLFVTEKDKLRVCIYYVIVVVAIFAIIFGISDNAYLSMAILFALLPLCVFKKSLMVWRFIIIVATLFSVIQCVDWINLYYTGPVLGIEGLFSVISKLPLLLPLVIGLWFAIILGYLLLKKRNKEKKGETKIFYLTWVGILILALAAIGFVLYDVNIRGNSSRYGSLAHYLLFDDAWGTDRGYIWRIAIEDFMKFSVFHKIFGHGPDTFRMVTYAHNYAEMVKLYNVVFENAHNEYIQYLVTNGILGMISYIVFIGSSIVCMLKKKENREILLAITFAVLCYAAQAFVNINPPIVSPIMWTLLMMGMSASREVTIDKDVEVNGIKRTV